MGKSKQITLNQEELRKICQNAVEDGVAKYINLEEQKKKAELFRVKSTISAFFEKALDKLPEKS